MASTKAFCSGTDSLESHLICSICTDLFVNPVTTTCGHTFCENCLNTILIYNDQTCPLCKQRLSSTPDVSIILRNIMEQMITPPVGDEEKCSGAPGEVTCDVCIGQKLRAKKSCLVCLTSYCSTHLLNHSSTERLKGHKLVQPVPDLDERACLQHGRPLELYSRKTERCICVGCLREGQEEVVSVENEWNRKKVSNISRLYHFLIESLDKSQYEAAEKENV